mmetsp:Transcript_29516/g.55677  ORF Transcript_29516/g.55677 Transcript_29516/m.55677 type:complete len:229 (-) Transcript_29516:152-838(-)
MQAAACTLCALRHARVSQGYGAHVDHRSAARLLQRGSLQAEKIRVRQGSLGGEEILFREFGVLRWEIDVQGYMRFSNPGPHRIKHLKDVHHAFAFHKHASMHLCLHLCVLQQPVGFLAEPDGAEAGVRAHARGGVDRVPKQPVEPPLLPSHSAHARARVHAHLEVQLLPAAEVVVRLRKLDGHHQHLLRDLHQLHRVLHPPRVRVRVALGYPPLHHGGGDDVVAAHVL